MISKNRFRRESQGGYSLPEIIIVVAIIGLIAAVSLPNFIGFYRSNKFKTSLRQFTFDLRSARQKAVARNLRTKVSLEAGADTNRTYSMFEGSRPDSTGLITWTLVRGFPKSLDESIHFEEINFDDRAETAEDPDDNLPDIIFRPDGTVADLPVNARVILTSKNKVTPKSYRVSLDVSGRISTAAVIP